MGQRGLTGRRTLTLRWEAGTAVVMVDGLVDDRLTSRAADAVPDDRAQRVVVDLRLGMLHDGESVRRLVRTLAAGRPHCLVCDRMTALLLLRRWGISAEYPVFTSVGDAIQAWLFHEAGYGPGWSAAGGDVGG